MAVVAVSLMRVPPTWDQPPRLPDENRINYTITTALNMYLVLSEQRNGTEKFIRTT